MDPGESAAECCAREVLEETGLVVEVGRLIGVYTTPDLVVEYDHYPNVNRVQPVSLCFTAKIVGGQLGLSDETTEVGYYSVEDIKAMDVWEHHRQRIEDVFADVDAAFVR